MTNQTILDRVNEILIYGNENDFYQCIQKIKDLKAKLIEDIEISEARKNGKVDILKGFKYILKNAKKNNAERFCKVFKYENQYIVTDSHSLLMYENDGNLNFAEMDNAEKAPEFIINILKTIPDGESQIDKDFVKINIPSTITLKNIISEQKAYNKKYHINKKSKKGAPIYYIDNEAVDFAINAEYLLNIINMGVSELYCKGSMFYGLNDDRTLKTVICGIIQVKERPLPR